MPLTLAKARHILNRLDTLYRGRTIPITLTCKASNGTVSLLTINAIMRSAVDADPAMTTVGADAIMLVKASDVPVAVLRSAVLVTPDPSTVQSALAGSYLITQIGPRGMLPAPDRFVVTLERQT